MARSVFFLIIVALAATTQPASAAIRITEWMYNGNGAENFGEFVELTNVGLAAIDLTGWSFDDSSGAPGSESLSGFGVVAAGESVIFTDEAAADFRANWNLSASVKVVGGNLNNLGRNDTINIYDAANAPVDQLQYGDQDFAGTIRTQNASGNPDDASALHVNNPALWSLAFDEDSFNSYPSLRGELGNPGQYAIVPEPATLALAAASLFVILGQRRRA